MGLWSSESWKMVSSLFLLRHTQQFLEDLNLLSALDLASREWVGQINRACQDIAPTANH
jgi:hypothetical protein